MIPLSAVIYIIKSGVCVLSLFFGLRLLFAAELTRETWRGGLRRYVYFTSGRFKILSILMGWVLLLLGLAIAYMEIDRLITA